jgi:hypothetical protein
MFHTTAIGAWDLGANPSAERPDPSGEGNQGLWDRIRAAERETEALNLNRKLHILGLFAEIASTALAR